MPDRFNRRRFLKHSASTVLAASAWSAPIVAARPLRFQSQP